MSVKELHACNDVMWHHEPYSSIILVNIIFVFKNIHYLVCTVQHTSIPSIARAGELVSQLLCLCEYFLLMVCLCEKFRQQTTIDSLFATQLFIIENSDILWAVFWALWTWCIYHSRLFFSWMTDERVQANAVVHQHRFQQCRHGFKIRILDQNVITGSHFCFLQFFSYVFKCAVRQS